MATAAELSVVLTAKDGVSAVLRNVEKDLHSVNKTALATGAAMTAMGAAMTAGVGQIGRLAADFEQSMSNVKAVLSPAEVNQFGDALGDLALKLGKDTVYSANEAAGALEELVKGGVRVTDILDGAAEATLHLASAGGTSLRDAAEIASNALNQFGLSGRDMAEVANLIAGAANASSMEVMDFKFAIQQSGAVASLAGLNFRDTATAISVMAAAGIKGSDAGTSLKTMLINLTPTSKEAIKQFRELGLITMDGANQFFDATGKVKGLADIAQVLQNALHGLSEEQQIMAIKTAFGTDAMRAAAIVAKAGAAGVTEMAEAMGKVSAADVAKARLDNLNGSIKQLQGSLETLAIQIGSKMAPGFRGLVDAATGVINFLIELPAPIQASIGQIALMTAGVLTLGGGLVTLGAALPVITAGLATFGLTIGAILGPITLVTAGIAAAILAWNTDFHGFRTTVEPILMQLGTLAQQFATDFMSAVAQVGAMIDTLRAPTTNLAVAFQEFGNAADGAVKALGVFNTASGESMTAIQAFGAAAHTAYQEFMIAAVDAWNAVLPTLLELRDWLSLNIPTAVATVQESWVSFWDQAGPTLTAAWAVMEPNLVALRDFIGVVLPPLFDALGLVASTTLKVIADDLRLIGQVLGPIAQAFNSTLGKMLTDLATNESKLDASMQRMFGERFGLTSEEIQTATESIGMDAIRGITIGFEKASPEVRAAMRENMRRILQEAKAELGIQSPSRAFAAEVGAPAAQGFAEGFVSEMPSATEQIGTAIRASMTHVGAGVRAFTDAQVRQAMAVPFMLGTTVSYDKDGNRVFTPQSRSRTEAEALQMLAGSLGTPVGFGPGTLVGRSFRDVVPQSAGGSQAATDASEWVQGALAEMTMAVARQRHTLSMEENLAAIRSDPMLARRLAALSAPIAGPGAGLWDFGGSLIATAENRMGSALSNMAIAEMLGGLGGATAARTAVASAAGGGGRASDGGLALNAWGGLSSFGDGSGASFTRVGTSGSGLAQAPLYLQKGQSVISRSGGTPEEVAAAFLERQQASLTAIAQTLTQGVNLASLAWSSGTSPGSGWANVFNQMSAASMASMASAGNPAGGVSGLSPFALFAPGSAGGALYQQTQDWIAQIVGRNGGAVPQDLNRQLDKLRREAGQLTDTTASLDDEQDRLTRVTRELQAQVDAMGSGYAAATGVLDQLTAAQADLAGVVAQQAGRVAATPTSSSSSGASAAITNGPMATLTTYVGGGELSVPILGAGGIVTAPTLALVGDSGPEAVIPLGRGGGSGAVNHIQVVYSPTVGYSDKREEEDAARHMTTLVMAELRRRGVRL